MRRDRRRRIRLAHRLVPQIRRRAEIRRFREDPECRLFLSSESGGVGLNLQAADTVVNLDQPWNPARLEQRIARAWRKHQTRPVTVINLVSEKTIEHRMLGLLAAKRALADGVLDRRGDLAEIRMPTGRAAFMERLNAALGTDGERTDAAAVEPEPRAAIDRLRDDLVTRHGAALQRILIGEDADQGEDGKTMLVVLDVPASRVAEEERRLAEATGMRVNVVEAATHEALLRLAGNGPITMATDRMREVHPAPDAAQERAAAHAVRARTLVEQATHKLKAAALLEGAGFAKEAQAPALEAARLAVGALAASRGQPEPEDAEAAAACVLRDGPQPIAEGVPHESDTHPVGRTGRRRHRHPGARVGRARLPNRRGRTSRGGVLDRVLHREGIEAAVARAAPLRQPQRVRPTLQELADTLGTAGPSVRDQITQLARKGYVVDNPKNLLNGGP